MHSYKYCLDGSYESYCQSATFVYRGKRSVKQYVNISDQNETPSVTKLQRGEIVHTCRHID